MKRIGILLMLIIMVGCARSYKTGLLKSASQMDIIKCVAVLPFDSPYKESGENPGRIVASMIANKLLATGKFIVLEWNELDALLKEQNVTLPSSIDAEYAARLGDILSVEGVIFGSVTEYGYKRGRKGNEAVPVVGVIAKLLSVRSKDIVWSGSFAKSSQDFIDTQSDPVSKVALGVVNDLVDSFSKKVKRKEIDYNSICWNIKISDDIDNDGILNFADSCPIEPESFEGIMDTDGCPEPEISAGNYRQLVELRDGRIVYQGKISYAKKEATLLPSAAPILKGVASLIKENPDIRRVTIEGYSEEEGMAKYQEEFSFNRAMSVKYFLMREGVPGDKLSAVGYEKVTGWKQSLVKEIEFSVFK